MELDALTFIPPDMREKNFRHLARMIGAPETPLQDLQARLNAALNAGELIYYRDGYPTGSIDEADTVQFATGLTTPTGEEIAAKCSANKRQGFQKWWGIFFEVLPRPGFAISDLYFPHWQDGPQFLEELATLAIPEKWTYDNFASRQKYPILRSYVAKTYERVKQQGKLIRQDGRVLFNTGLINKWFKEIYVVCDEDPANSASLLGARPVLENDRVVLEAFKNRTPAIATFFDQLSDVMFDPTLEVVTNDVHIIEENIARIPREYRTMRTSQVFALFQSAVEFARIIARRNYKLVIPHYYAGRIQFLMPIYLSGEFSGTPDCALALERIHDCYRGNTILTLDMAYQNARLIAKPDPTWLNPDTITDEAEERP
ncbi:MAG TPA: DUF3825 domain-containing protein [Symbiobacteriaceae bacterium]|nr:DUF3825 domain-containing protein [Symbiobacteriaceae bacterium]